MARKKDRLTIVRAQEVARAVAGSFSAFQCDACAREIAIALGKDFEATFERLTTSDNSDVIGLAREDVRVSVNRAHVGVRVGDLIFDNIHHGGVAAVEWPRRFIAATEAPLEHEAQPVSSFFKEVFLVRQYNLWLFSLRKVGP